MIVVRLKGGLGNQLFQYATARELSFRHAAELVLDTNWFDKQLRNETARRLEITNYFIEARVMNHEEELLSGRYRNRLLRFLPLSNPWVKVREKNFNFDGSLANLTDDVYLDGYWQSYRYFCSIESLLKKELVPKQAEIVEETDISRMIASENSVSVHVRRGDYVTDQSTSRYHGICSVTYYKSAVDFMLKKLRTPVFFVFSDDMAWAKSSLSFDAPTFYVEHSGPHVAIQDLYLMSRCRHQIIANSSFSWWGAWLNDNRDKIVVAPDPWFADSSIDTKDLIPGDWTRIGL